MRPKSWGMSKNPAKQARWRGVKREFNWSFERFDTAFCRWYSSQFLFNPVGRINRRRTRSKIRDGKSDNVFSTGEELTSSLSSKLLVDKGAKFNWQALKSRLKLWIGYHPSTKLGSLVSLVEEQDRGRVKIFALSFKTIQRLNMPTQKKAVSIDKVPVDKLQLQKWNCWEGIQRCWDSSQNLSCD